jgi:hypothetical protein
VSEENKDMVRRMVEGINAGDIEATVDELFAPRGSAPGEAAVHGVLHPLPRLA